MTTRILLLIPYTSSYAYERAMYESLKEYLSTRKEVTTYFIQLREQSLPIEVEGSTIWLRGEESIKPGILIKTIGALEYCVASGIEFEWVVRANISTAINFARFPYDELAEVGCDFAGSWVGIHDGVTFVGGTDITFSRKCAVLLLQYKQHLDYLQLDDVACAALLTRLGVRPYQFRISRRESLGAAPGEYRNETTSYAEVTPGMITGGYAYRHRTDDRDADARQLATILATFNE